MSPASAAKSHLSSIVKPTQVGTVSDYLGDSRDRFGEPQFLNDAIVTKVMSGPLAQ
jgi:hypothetical protein